ncbi:MAG: hypothetical protein HYY44_08630 [Deltaproteobacteria bacterium]|nr:hypothetical protein [Deltaproteobacteria bacterium]
MGISIGSLLASPPGRMIPQYGSTQFPPPADGHTADAAGPDKRIPICGMGMRRWPETYRPANASGSVRTGAITGGIIGGPVFGCLVYMASRSLRLAIYSGFIGAVAGVGLGTRLDNSIFGDVI